MDGGHRILVFAAIADQQRSASRMNSPVEVIEGMHLSNCDLHMVNAVQILQPLYL
jgi:hypothetical protein